MGQQLRAHPLAELWFPEPTLGLCIRSDPVPSCLSAAEIGAPLARALLLVTLAPGDTMPSSGFHRHVHACAQMHAHSHTHTYIFNLKKAF